MKRLIFKMIKLIIICFLCIMGITYLFILLMGKKNGETNYNLETLFVQCITCIIPIVIAVINSDADRKKISKANDTIVKMIYEIKGGVGNNNREEMKEKIFKYIKAVMDVETDDICKVFAINKEDALELLNELCDENKIEKYTFFKNNPVWVAK